MRRTGGGGDDEGIIFLLFVFMIVAVVVFVVALTCHQNNKPALTDPKKGIVYLQNNVSKFCDKTTLIYQNDQGISSIPNSAECK